MDLPEDSRPENLSALTDDQLVARLKALDEADRCLTVCLIQHLCEFDARDLHEELGFPSLFAYCVEELGYSEDVACKGIAAARACARFPAILPFLRDGRLTLSAIVTVAPAFTPSNHSELLCWAVGRKKRELEAFVASAMPERTGRDRLRWLDESSVEVRFTADRRLADLLERMREINRHKYPDGRYGDLMEEALELYLGRHDPDRDLLPSRRRESDPHSRAIPSAVKKDVWRRDHGRCTYVSTRGRRCGSRAWLEFDHIEPWAKGGRSDTPENIRLLCRAHNQRLARQEFGIRALPKKIQGPELPLLERGAPARHPPQGG